MNLPPKFTDAELKKLMLPFYSDEKTVELAFPLTVDELRAVEEAVRKQFLDTFNVIFGDEG